MLKPSNPFSYYVALEEDGVPKFSSNPKAHATRVSAEAEADRLARLHPGKTFGIYTRNNDSRSTFTHEPSYSLADLQNTSPTGVYRIEGSVYKDMRVSVSSSFGNRSLTFITPGRIEPLRPEFWTSAKFYKTEERVAIIKNGL